ncbi:MAG: ATP-binding protein, partial [Lachnospiraceae bacterium]|nr:ATP-binding protein [Lachnospiraceae bacterium]
MSELQQKNLPAVSAGKLVSLLADAYGTVIRSGLSIRSMPSVMLWGPPGVGKSQAVRQIGERIAEKTGKKVNITDVRLLMFNPIDLRGIPTANADKTLAVWLRPKIFEMDASDDVVNILFLDEISAAPQS